MSKIPTRAVARVAGLVVALASSLLFTAWALFPGVRRATAVESLPPLSALSLVMGGIALQLAALPATPGRRVFGALFATGMATIGALVLIEDAATLRGLLDLEEAMSPLSALFFVLLGLALVLIHVRSTRVRLAEAFGLSALLVPFFVVVADLYGVGTPRIGSPLSMPLGVAVACLVLGVGVLLVSPRGRVMERILSPSAGGAMARMLLPSVILVPLAIGGVLVLGRASQLLGEEAYSAVHTLGTVLALGAVTWLTSGRLQRLDGMRERAIGDLASSEARFRALATASAQIVWLTGPDGRPKEDSPSWRAFTGQSVDDWLSGRWTEALHPDDRDRVLTGWRDAVAAGRGLEAEYRLRRADGTWVWTAVRAAPVLDERGRPHEWIGTNTDITRRKEDELAIESTTRRLRALAEVSHELARAGLDAELVAGAVVGSVCELLGDGCILAVVQKGGFMPLSFSHLEPELHRAGRELLVDPSLDIAHLLVEPAIQHQRMIVLDQVADADIEAWPEPVRRFLRTLRVRSLIIAPVIADDGPLGALAVFRGDSSQPYDIKDRLVLEELANRAVLAFQNVRLYERAQTAIRLRDEFLSVASHELRTPLTTLKLQVSAALLDMRKAGDEARLERFRRLDAQIDRMTRLVNQLLDVSRILDGRLALEPQEVDLLALTREVVDWFRDQSVRARSPIAFHEAEHVVGRWDANRIGQVITNLLSNALKYGAGKPIEVSVERDDEHARLVVVDHGIGVAAEDQGRIFERFERASSVRNYGGLGLGLWISKEIVEQHGGHIHVDSRPEEGASFIVELPLEATQDMGARG